MLRSIGCLDPIPADGRIHRWKPEGRGRANGWAVLHRDGAATWGVAGNWATGERITIRDGHVSVAAIKRVNDDLERLARKEAAKAQIKAGIQWSRASFEGESPYLIRKNVKAYGLKYQGDAIIVPMRDFDDGLRGTQTIFADGFKLFTKGCKPIGRLHNIPGKSFTVIAEGYATAASIHEATGFGCIVAFNAGNLLPVAQAIRLKNPKAQIIIAADDDRETPGNPGLTKANEAAKAIKAKVAVPPDGGDFNDMHCAKGLTDVALALYAAL